MWIQLIFVMIFCLQKYSAESTNDIFQNVDFGPERQLTLDFIAHGLTRKLVLNQRQDMMSKNFTIFLQENGTVKTKQLKHHEITSCSYVGKIGNQQNSLVGLSIYNGITGIINDGETLYNSIHSGCKHFLDIRKTSTDNRFLYQRSSWNSVKYPKKFIELFVVTDKDLSDILKTTDYAISYTRSILNILNLMYESLNIKIVLTGIMTLNEKNLFEIDSNNMTKTLQHFIQFRHKFLLPAKPHDLAILFTADSSYNGDERGKATVGTMCKESGGAVVSLGTVNPAEDAAIVAHEIGHAIKMGHDNDCDFSVMTGGTNPNRSVPNQWSQKSLDRWAKNAPLFTCLDNEPEEMAVSGSCPGLANPCQSNPMKLIIIVAGVVLIALIIGFSFWMCSNWQAKKIFDRDIADSMENGQLTKEENEALQQPDMTTLVLIGNTSEETSLLPKIQTQSVTNISFTYIRAFHRSFSCPRPNLDARKHGTASERRYSYSPIQMN